jgi:hypothetical protein
MAKEQNAGTVRLSVFAPAKMTNEGLIQLMKPAK